MKIRVRIGEVELEYEEETLLYEQPKILSSHTGMSATNNSATYHQMALAAITHIVDCAVAAHDGIYESEK